MTNVKPNEAYNHYEITPYKVTQCTLSSDTLLFIHIELFEYEAQ